MTNQSSLGKGFGFFDSLIEQGLKDDGQPWDFTTIGALQGLDPKRATLQAAWVAKAHGIWAGEKVLSGVSRLSSIEVLGKVVQGARLKKGDVICTWRGPARELLAFERPALNLASYVCGIATRTDECVGRVGKAWKKLGSKLTQSFEMPRVTSTRKILPHYRDVCFEGVLAGGGALHRTDLTSGILIKENHIAACGSIKKAITQCRSVAPHTLKVEIEVRNQDELIEAINSRADIVMLDNFKPSQVKAALKMIQKSGLVKPTIEISGGVTLESISDFVIPGVDLISMGSLTHSVTAFDISMLFDSLQRSAR